MYFGSIRFYKHVILIVMTLVVVFSISSCVFMGISNHHIKKALKDSGLTLNTESSSITTDPQLSEKEKRSQYYFSSFNYQKSYPNLMVTNDFFYNEDSPKSVYLTFDDGPSSLTSKILDILKEYNIKATFFIVYNNSTEAKALYKRMIDEGHTIGVHSTSHQYPIIYQSTSAFLEDFAQTALMLENTTGVKPEIFRFPGGSINSYNKAIYQQIIAEMIRRGYTYYDWNVSAEDATNTITEEQIYSNVVNGVQKYNKAVVLMHDSGNKFDTISALPNVINDLQSKGYNFYPLTRDVKPVIFDYVD